jgi:hypothetical protein
MAPPPTLFSLARKQVRKHPLRKKMIKIWPWLDDVLYRYCRLCKMRAHSATTTLFVLANAECIRKTGKCLECKPKIKKQDDCWSYFGWIRKGILKSYPLCTTRQEFHMSAVAQRRLGQRQRAIATAIGYQNARLFTQRPLVQYIFDRRRDVIGWADSL